MTQTEKKHTLIFVLFILVTNFSSAHALEWLPEFQSLTETEQQSFEGPDLQSSEYQADLLTYLKPNEWNYLWLTHNIAADFSYGSIGAAHFMADRRIKLWADLNPSIQFRLTSLEEGNRDHDTQHTVIETVLRPLPVKWIGVSLYAEPVMYKRNLDTGVALILNPTERHEIRVFNTFVDITRYRRSDRPDRFELDALPYSRGIVGRTWSDPKSGKKNFLEYALRHETPTRWEFPAQMYMYRYWKNFASVYWNQSITERTQGSIRAQWDRKFESRNPTSSLSSEPSRTWTTERLFVTLRQDTSLDAQDRYRISGGMQYARRQWITESGTVLTRALIPYTDFQIPTWGDGEKEDHFHLGYMVTWSRAWGPGHIRGIFHPDNALEHRINLAYDIRFRPTASIRLQASMDPDERPRYWFEGGNIQLQVAF